jgi:hypothetical protein
MQFFTGPARGVAPTAPSAGFTTGEAKALLLNASALPDELLKETAKPVGVFL